MEKTLAVRCGIVFLSLVATALFLFPSADKESIAGVAPILVAQAEQPEPEQPVVEEQPVPPEIRPEEMKQPEAVQGAPAEPRKVKGARQAQLAASTVSFFFDDADIFEVVQTVFGDVLKVNYIIDPKVKGKVNFRTVTPIPREEVLPIIEIILRINGIGFVEERGVYNIVPLTDASKELAFAQVGKEPQKAAIELFTFKNLNIKDSMKDIEGAIGLGLESGKIKVIPIERLNALMVMASTKEQMDYIRKWIETFDTMFADARPKVFVYSLQNSKAVHVASMLQSILGGGGGGGAAAPTPTPTPAPAQRTGLGGTTAPSAGLGGGGLGGTTAPSASTTQQAARTGPAATVTATGGFLVSPETKIFADEINNSLIILATPTDYAFLEEMIKKVDVVSRQVVLEGLIVQVTLSDNLSFGFGYALSTNAGIQNLKPFTTTPMPLTGNIGVNAPAASTPLPTTGFGFVATDPTGIARLAITALQDKSKALVLAAPHILVADNREANIQVGSSVPLATSTTTAPLTSVGTVTTPTLVNTSTSTIEYKDIGIILKVKPQVNDSGLVSLEISQEVSSLGSTVTIAGQAYSSINKTVATTNLVSHDGETIIIGGLIRTDVTKSNTGIPFLSSIPLIGPLFSSISDTTARVELIILLTPHVVKNQQEAEGVTSDYTRKLKDEAKDKDVDKFIKDRSKTEKKDDTSGAQDSKKQ